MNPSEAPDWFVWLPFVIVGGFFLQVMPLFRFGHPPLFIPWTEISARQPMDILWTKSERLSIGHAARGVIDQPPPHP